MPTIRFLRGSQPTDERANLTDAFTREACDFIHRHCQQPFFLKLSYNAVHSPMQATQIYLDRHAAIDDIHRRIFAGMLSHLDDSLGQVLGQLQVSGVEDRTLVFFLSDNGGPTKELTSSNAPLRGGKGDLFEGGIRVPFIASWKGRIAPQAIATPVISLDIAATALAAAGALSASEQQLDGVNLLPLLSNASTELPVRNLFWRVGKKHALRSGDWKLIRDQVNWQLYKLDEDLGETRDLALSQPEIVQRLSSAWQQWNAGLKEPLWK